MSQEIWNKPQETASNSSFLQKSTGNKLQVTLFVLNPVHTEDEIKFELNRVYKNLQDIFEPWLDHYIWCNDLEFSTGQNKEPIDFQICQHDQYHYIYGEIHLLGETTDDEWLIAHLLLQRLSKLSHPDLHIQISNTVEGEFLLVEGYEHVPDWISPENASNRIWINQGQITIIPEEYYAERSLSLHEALLFLERAGFRCLKIEEFNRCVLEKLSEYPTRALKRQGFVSVEIPRKLAAVIIKKENKEVLGHSVLRYAGRELSQLALENDEEEEEIEDHVDEMLQKVLKRALRSYKSDCDTQDLVHLRVKVNGLAYLFIRYHQELLSQQSECDESYTINDIFTYSLTKYIEDSGILIEDIPTPSDLQINEYNSKGDELQKELIRLMLIDEVVESELESLPKETKQTEEEDSKHTEIEEKNMIEALKNFFGDQEENTKESPDSSSDEDEKARKFFQDNKVDIDEDDFFEFFSKEALKLSEEELEKFRQFQQDLHSDITSQPEEDPMTDGEDEDQDEGEEEDLKDSLRQLLKAMDIEGGSMGSNDDSGNISSFFKAMMDQKN
ncbi:hypothetical protein WICPIJ_003803 [Wickerhamomyces pijperi]|uniref:Uncharacterized protein n=1 Tax=Wickerhamomyces pijperi TaxID=599730 RepID=A0A9P8Q968_WICPI|nr:hypothetical protein WICPIJ_003803 [Wickerhamomyces pijperi]